MMNHPPRIGKASEVSGKAIHEVDGVPGQSPDDQPFSGWPNGHDTGLLAEKIHGYSGMLLAGCQTPGYGEFYLGAG